MAGHKVTLSFEKDEQEILRSLAEHFHSGSSRILIRAIPIPDDCNEAWRDETLKRLHNYGLIDRSNKAVTIKTALIKAVDDLNNPKTPNYWKETVDWWFSARWRAGVTIVVVLLPLLVQWIEMLSTILAWILTDPSKNQS